MTDVDLTAVPISTPEADWRENQTNDSETACREFPDPSMIEGVAKTDVTAVTDVPPSNDADSTVTADAEDARPDVTRAGPLSIAESDRLCFKVFDDRPTYVNRARSCDPASGSSASRGAGKAMTRPRYFISGSARRYMSRPSRQTDRTTTLGACCAFAIRAACGVNGQCRWNSCAAPETSCAASC
jgi:hypothetical protein